MKKQFEFVENMHKNQSFFDTTKLLRRLFHTNIIIQFII